MTKEEAIKYLSYCAAEPYCYDYKKRNCSGCNTRKALTFGILALQESISYDKQVEALRRMLHKEMLDED